MATLTSEMAKRTPRGADRALRASAASGASALPPAPGPGGRLSDRLLWLSRRRDADALVQRADLGLAELRATGPGAEHPRSARRLAADERLHPGLRHHLADRGHRDVLHAAARLSGRLRALLGLRLPGEPADDPRPDPVLDEHPGPLLCLDGAPGTGGDHQRGDARQRAAHASRCSCSTRGWRSTPG